MKMFIRNLFGSKNRPISVSLIGLYLFLGAISKGIGFHDIPASLLGFIIQITLCIFFINGKNWARLLLAFTMSIFFVFIGVITVSANHHSADNVIGWLPLYISIVLIISLVILVTLFKNKKLLAYFKPETMEEADRKRLNNPRSNSIKITAIAFIFYLTFLVTARLILPTPSSPENYESPFKDRESIKLDVHSIAVLDNKHGCIVLGIRRISGKSVYYKWRFYDIDSKKETSGVGAATYREITLKDTGDTAVLFDYGSDEFLDTGKIKVLWMPNDDDSIWVYYSPSATTIKLIPEAKFETYKPKSE